MTNSATVETANDNSAARVYISTTERAAMIRAQLKRELGASSRQVSVKSDSFSMGSAIRVLIKDASVSMADVKRIAMAHERVDRCSMTGDILSGGNRYINIDYCQAALRPLREEFEAALRAVENTDEVTESRGFVAYQNKSGDGGYSGRDYWTATNGEKHIHCWGLEFCARQMAEHVAGCAR